MAALLYSHLFYVVSHLKNVQTVDHMYTGLQSMQIKHYYAMNTKRQRLFEEKTLVYMKAAEYHASNYKIRMFFNQNVRKQIH
mgnify:CR=1 FL=1